MKVLTIKVDDTVYELLEVLTRGDMFGNSSVEQIVDQLIDHAQQGVYRPGSWERPWLEQAFGSHWLKHLEPGDPYERNYSGRNSLYARPRRS